ncbi:MAG: hypothetical protein AAGJ93_03820 [Bacteroidota bacterium]
MSNESFNSGGKVIVEKPKTKDPEVQFELTREDSSGKKINFNSEPHPIKYVWGSLHFFDNDPAHPDSEAHNHMVVSKASSGSTPITGDSALLTFKMDDKYWDAIAEKGNKVSYYLLVTFHNSNEFNGIAYSGTFTPNQGGTLKADPNDPEPSPLKS